MSFEPEVVINEFSPEVVATGPPGSGGGTGTNDHNTALNRDLPDQHPQSAITALVTDLLAIVAAIQGLTDSKEDEGVAAGLITDLINASDPFTQYLLDSEANTVISENTDVAANKTHREITSGNPHGTVHSDLSDKGTNDHAVIDTALTVLANLLDRTTGENTGDQDLGPYALIETVLLKGNTDDPVFMPALDNDPANKKFVEDNAVAPGVLDDYLKLSGRAAEQVVTGDMAIQAGELRVMTFDTDPVWKVTEDFMENEGYHRRSGVWPRQQVITSGGIHGGSKSKDVITVDLTGANNGGLSLHGPATAYDPTGKFGQIIQLSRSVDDESGYQFEVTGTGSGLPFYLEPGDLVIIVSHDTHWQAHFIRQSTILPSGTVTEFPHAEGLIYYDQDARAFIAYNDESALAPKIGRDFHIRVYNDTGSALLKGKVCYLSGVHTDGVFTVSLAKSDLATTCLATIGFTDHEIGIGEHGYIKTLGVVEGLSNTGHTTAAALWLSDTTAGGYTETKPDSPSYCILLGTCGKVGDSDGSIDVKVDDEGNTDGLIKIYNGLILESYTVTVLSDEGVVTVLTERTGGGDLNLIFDGDFTHFDSTPAASIAINHGTDTVPVLNYVFIPKSTRDLTVTTTGFPAKDTGQYVPIGTFLCQSPETVETDGLLKFHAWSDHLAHTNGEGHFQHWNRWIREQPATYLKGITFNAIVGVGQFDVTATVGSMLQLHEHPTDPFDTTGLSVVYVFNDPVTSYKKVGDLTAELTDSSGGSLSGRMYSFVFWIAGNEGSGNDKLFCNLPSDSYSVAASAIRDTDGYTDRSIPKEFKGVGVLISRVTVRHQTTGGGTWTLLDLEDLREGAGGGTGGTGGGGVDSYLELTDTPNSFTGQAARTHIVNAGETGLEFAYPTGYRGNMTTAQRDALSDPALGDWILNTEFRLRRETYQGLAWVPDKYGWAERLEDYWEPHVFTIDPTGPDGWTYEVAGSPAGITAVLTATDIYLEAVITPGSAVIVKKTFDLSPLLITQIAEMRVSYRMDAAHDSGVVDGGISVGVEMVSGTDYARAVYETGDFEYVGIQKHIGNEGEVRTMVPENWISGSGMITTYSTLTCDSGDGILLTFGEEGEGQNGEVNKDSSYRWADGPTSVDLIFKLYAEPDVITSARKLMVRINEITFKAAI